MESLSSFKQKKILEKDVSIYFLCESKFEIILGGVGGVWYLCASDFCVVINN